MREKKKLPCPFGRGDTYLLLQCSGPSTVENRNKRRKKMPRADPGSRSQLGMLSPA